MSSAYLTWGVLLATAALALAGDIVSLGNDLTKQCQFTVDGHRYDVCRIINRNNGVWTFTDDRETPPSVTTHQYLISFGGPLPKNESLADDEQCPEGTWVCMTKTNRRPNHDEAPRIIETIPVAGELSPSHCDNYIRRGHYYPGLNVTAQMRKFGEEHEPVMSISLQGGYYVDRKQSLTLRFDCHPDAEESTLHHFEGGFEGWHVLNYKSKWACPRSSNDPPSGDEEQELVGLPAKERAMRRFWTIAFSSVCAIFLVAYCTRSRRLRSKVQGYLKSHPSLLRFRVGENVLVRWAHEDLELDESEEDVMVNATAANYTADDEQIPLKPSPRMGSITGYGTAK